MTKATTAPAAPTAAATPDGNAKRAEREARQQEYDTRRERLRALYRQMPNEVLADLLVYAEKGADTARGVGRYDVVGRIITMQQGA